MAIPRNLANLANQLNGDGDVPKIEVGDSKVQVTDTGSNGTIVFNTDNVERGRFGPTNEFYFGNGSSSATPNNFVVSGTTGSGTDVAGANLTIRPGFNTGNGNGGRLALGYSQTNSASGTAQRGGYTALFACQPGPGTRLIQSYGTQFTTPPNFNSYGDSSAFCFHVFRGCENVGTGGFDILQVCGNSGGTSAQAGTIELYQGGGNTSCARLYGQRNSNSDDGCNLFLENSNGGTTYTGMHISGAGRPFFPNHVTTASAANAVISSDELLRSTSSLRYKTDVESLWTQKADAVLSLRPVWYRSLCNGDNNGWSWYGLIAEEVAEVEPRLVHWTYLPEAYEEVTKDSVDKEGNLVLDDKGIPIPYTEKVLKPDAEMVPDGVQYDRLTVLLLDVIKRQNQRIETLEVKVAALEAK